MKQKEKNHKAERSGGASNAKNCYRGSDGIFDDSELSYASTICFGGKGKLEKIWRSV
jgi:hypothetical protein